MVNPAAWSSYLPEPAEVEVGCVPVGEGVHEGVSEFVGVLDEAGVINKNNCAIIEAQRT